MCVAVFTAAWMLRDQMTAADVAEICKGVLATNYKYDWNGKKEFLIDAACFPGSSGSPVMLFDIGSYSTREGITISDRIKLLGVLYASPQHTVKGKLQIVEVPTQAVSVAGPNNLGIIIKSEELNAFASLLRNINKGWPQP